MYSMTICSRGWLKLAIGVEIRLDGFGLYRLTTWDTCHVQVKDIVL